MSRGWVCARYHTHCFHYRMPETVAVNAFNPVVPSPLTVKLAVVAALMQSSDLKGARNVAPALWEVSVRVRPPRSAVVFRALMRYVRPPDPADKVDEGTGGRYIISPHYREYAIFSDPLEVYLRVPDGVRRTVERGLRLVNYLGAKDSLVTCLEVTEEDPPEQAFEPVDPDAPPVNGTVVRLADVTASMDLEALLPGSRSKRKRKQDFSVGPYLLPGVFTSEGSTRVFTRERRSQGFDVVLG